MRIAPLLLVISSCLLTLSTVGCAQQKSNATVSSAGPNAQLHADVLKLIEVNGMKQSLQSNLGQMIDQGKAAILQQKPQLCDSRFVEEWGNRMRQQVKVDDFLQVVANVYEKYFTDAEIKEMIELRSAKGKGTTSPVPSPELKSKMDKVAPSVQSEIIGGCTQVGAKLGAEIGRQVQKDHPDYCKQ